MIIYRIRMVSQFVIEKQKREFLPSASSSVIADLHRSGRMKPDMIPRSGRENGVLRAPGVPQRESQRVRLNLEILSR